MKVSRYSAAAMGIAAALSGCSAGESPLGLRQSNLPPEVVAKAECPAENCLIVEADSEYCSIDPPRFLEAAPFATKSRLVVKSGVYPLGSKRGPIANLEIGLTTRDGAATLAPADEGAFVIEASEPGSETLPIEWIEFQSSYAGEGAAIKRFFLRTSRWPHRQFRLGDPGDVKWFYEAARNLFIEIEDGAALFPGLERATIFYAPCDMRGLADEVFTFAFADGGRLDLTVRAINGAGEIGYYMGRLLSAEGSFRGAAVEVSERDDLAFYGSTRSWAEPAIPTLAVRIADKGEACGVVFDASQWDTDRAVNGYVAYELTCDGRLGASLPLTAADRPARYTLP